MNGILRLGILEDDFHYSLVFIDIEILTERLVVFGVDLDQNLTFGRLSLHRKPSGSSTRAE